MNADFTFLKRTIELAKEASAAGDYPIGALIVDGKGNIVVEDVNRSFSNNDPSSHAEINCIRSLGERLIEVDSGNILYSSLEPCFGCSFFLRYTKIRNIVWALSDTFKGGMTELRDFEKTKEDFEQFTIIEEPYEELRTESARLMYEYLSSKGKIESASHYI